MTFMHIAELWAPGGFICGRHMAGLAYTEGAEALENYRSGRGYYGSEAPMPYGRAFFAFIGGFLGWPAVYGTMLSHKLVTKTPAKVWDICKYVFIKPPPKRIRKEKRLAQLQKQTAVLEKELNL